MYYDSNGNPRAVEERSANTLAACLTKVYWWMTLALAVSGFSAYIVGTSEGLTKILIKNPGIFFGLAVVEIVMVIGIGMGIRKLSAATATALFILYAAVNGITLSVVFIAYQLSSVAQVFGITAATFAVMALVGTTTKRDLSGLGNMLFMALLDLTLDLKRANLGWTNELAPIKQSFQVLVAIFGTWIYCIALAGIYLALTPPIGAAAYLFLFAGVTALAALVLYLWLRRKGGKVFMEL